MEGHFALFLNLWLESMISIGGADLVSRHFLLRNYMGAPAK